MVAPLYTIHQSSSAEMTTEMEVKEQYVENVREQIKDMFSWAFGETPMNEMTSTVCCGIPNITV